MQAAAAPVTYDEMILRELASLPPRGQELVKKYFANNNLMLKRDKYFCRGRVQASVTGTTTKTYTITAGTSSQLVFFGYGLGDPLTNAGFPTSFGNASYQDTNIPIKFQTKDGELFEIKRVSLQVHPFVDPKVAQIILADAWLEAGTGSDVKPYKLGVPMMVPGGSAPITAGYSNVMEAPLPSPTAPVAGNPANSWQVAQSTLDLSYDSIIWAPPGEADSLFSCNLNFARNIVWTMSDRAAAAGTTAAQVAPSSGERGTYIDFFLILEGRQVARRSSNR